MAAVTLTEVARRAGVSLATASRVLNGSSRTPSPDIAERVRGAATELGYVANAQAQALARASTRLVGLVVHDIGDPYFSSIARGVQGAAAEAQHQVLLAAAEAPRAQPQEGATSVLAAVQAFVSYRVDAVILAGSSSLPPDPALLAALAGYRDRGGRVVTIGQDWVPGAGAVLVDNQEGSALLVRDLVADGQRRLAYLAGPEGLATVEDRVAGYRSAVAEAGAEDLGVFRDSFDSAGGERAARQLLEAGVLDSGGEPVTVLAANDVMALGAAAELGRAGRPVPERVRLAGFDDIPSLAYSTPALTTVRLPLEQMGARAAALALSPTPGLEHVAGEVVRRASA
ncbi:LacI family DNA-binding transcriptional regulator [Ornithinicoccus halotolerans]|uniref:LacI family DNA-binding transcriptional regulator n=1 Tax=Ornithinicoccus halotolerans TaxID=1748220 RepID=UPI0012952282|nr:LacI family DNA-binding transcriptional regulator [Ornithinicoccus halotolerans]